MSDAVLLPRARACSLSKASKPIGFTPWFDEIICADDVEHPKPAPDALLECLHRFGCKPEDAVYIGDSEYDMQCARSAGVKSVLALWGCVRGGEANVRPQV